MADPRDEALRKRYRELATEEPSAAIDDAIRAAARRAVSSGPGTIRKPGAARWAVPVSVAAVLFLSFSVVMRLEKEAPPIVEPTPSIVASPAPASVAPPATVAPPASISPSQAPAAANAPVEVAKEQSLSFDKSREQPRLAAPAPLAKEKKDAAVVESKPEVLADAISPAKPEPPKAAAPSFAPPPSVATPTATTPPPAPAAPPPAPAASMAAPAPQERALARAAEEQRNAAPGRRDEATGMLGAQGATAQGSPQPQRAKVEGSAAKRVAEDVDSPWPDTPEKKLERVEALRKAGRDKEADEALARFKREHPAYEIPDATWQRIKPR